MTTYKERLLDPRWQRRRLEILQRADFGCERCSATEKTLHVHHRIYRKGAMPWEYTDEELMALCKDCHESETQIREQLQAAMAKMDDFELDRLLGYAQGLVTWSSIRDGESFALRNAEHAMGVSDVVGTRDVDSLEMYEVLGARNVVTREDFDRLYALRRSRVR